MTVDCDVAKTFLSIVWFVVGAAIFGPIGFVLGRRIRASRELYYRGPGGGQR